MRQMFHEPKEGHLGFSLGHFLHLLEGVHSSATYQTCDLCCVFQNFEPIYYSDRRDGLLIFGTIKENNVAGTDCVGRGMTQVCELDRIAHVADYTEKSLLLR